MAKTPSTVGGLIPQSIRFSQDQLEALKEEAARTGNLNEVARLMINDCLTLFGLPLAQLARLEPVAKALLGLDFGTYEGKRQFLLYLLTDFQERLARGEVDVPSKGTRKG